jgi:aminoglycoside phosphotransferase (APT) family kinase protein
MARPAGSAPRIVDSAWRRTPFVKEVGTLLARLHERTPPAAVRQILPEINARKEIMRINKLARRHGDNALREASDELAEQEIEGQAFPLCVVHGAVAIDALLCDAQGITTVLGWENAVLADPRWDVASFTIELRAHDAGDLVDPFWAAYSDRAGIQLANPDYWEALAALQRWAMAGDTAQPQDPWRQEAWHALTRLRYRQEHASTSDDNKQDR